ncbi:luciferase family protein [Nonomuraea sp. NPDC050536]|uniref:luciferase domain-containing protein n=1 Tax=Nonomuraea sp. NPDC050536 TaxID=3364366 RepID=UPI0037C9282E
MTELRSWPALAAHDRRGGVTFSVDGTEILRLAGDDRAQLRLTIPAIDRLQPQLEASGQVSACADKAWVAMKIEAEPDLDLLLSLTSVAIKANTT